MGCYQPLDRRRRCCVQFECVCLCKCENILSLQSYGILEKFSSGQPLVSPVVCQDNFATGKTLACQLVIFELECESVSVCVYSVFVCGRKSLAPDSLLCRDA